MSQFEYLTVVVSIILGLGIAHLLSGIGRTIHRRSHTRVDAVHTLWTVSLFEVLVLNWWIFFQWRERPDWSFGTFVIVVVWAVTFYLMTVVLYPPDLDEGEDFGDVFERNRSWFLGLFVASSVADVALTATLGDILDPPHYLPFVAHFIVLGLLGVVWQSRRFHLALASWVLIISLSWSFIVRRFLT